MKNRWDENEANRWADDPLQMRVYTSRLLGREPALVLHGGGNTSVKDKVTNVFGVTEEVLYVKGSGWDLATIEAQGFSPVKLDVLKQLADLEGLSDSDMVRVERAAMTDPSAPTPSVEAILHAIIPFKYVDHTHADSVVLITNTEEGDKRIKDIYGDEVLVIPYVMPGFILAKTVYQATRDVDWKSIRGIILLNHGVFTFADAAGESYGRMIDIVSKAERYLEQQVTPPSPGAAGPEDLVCLARLRRAVSTSARFPVLARLDTSPMSAGFAGLADAASMATRGPLTPDHVIRTKRIPLVVGGDPEADVTQYEKAYRAYFEQHAHGDLTCLDPAPRWAVWPGHGTATFGRSVNETDIIMDITRHTIAAIQTAESLGGWRPLPEKDIFDVEYWELEQAKLRKKGARAPLMGKVALVTGAASGIGLASAELLRNHGAAVAALDINPEVTERFGDAGTLGLVCDVTDAGAIRQAVDSVVREFGGLDILVSNAGIFPPGEDIVETNPDNWERTLAVNLTAHERLLQSCIPYLEHGVEPAVVIIGSKNVAAPGRGASAYSVSKAGLTQLGRVAALELGPLGIRVNVIHPNNVFDTAIWTDEVLEDRARRQGMTVGEYKTNNVMGVDVTSNDVAAMVCAVVGPAFAKTTGAQIPVDGGNERVI